MNLIKKIKPPPKEYSKVSSCHPHNGSKFKRRCQSLCAEPIEHHNEKQKMGKEDEMLFFKYGEGSILFFSGRGIFPSQGEPAHILIPSFSWVSPLRASPGVLSMWPCTENLRWGAVVVSMNPLEDWSESGKMHSFQSPCLSEPWKS